MDSRLDFESERVSPGFFGEVDLGSKPGLISVHVVPLFYSQVLPQIKTGQWAFRTRLWAFSILICGF